MSKILITDYYKLNFRKKTKIIFKDEYLKNLYLNYKSQNYNFEHIETLNDVFYKNRNIGFVKQQIFKSICKSLNKIHNINYSVKIGDY